MSWYIYALCEPDSDRIRYIGKSRNPSMRLVSHMSKHRAPFVRQWVLSIGIAPTLKILGRFDDEVDALLDEQRRIKELADSGLLNVCAGGSVSGERRSSFSGIGKRVKELRISLGITRMYLEEVSGIASGIVGRLERGKRSAIAAETAVLLARALGTTVEYLVTGEAVSVSRAS